jgi:hypothetical protein
MPLLSVLVLVLALSACALPESSGPARQCIPDSSICYFPDDPNAPANPYAR